MGDRRLIAKSFGITRRCAGVNMKARIDCSSAHSVRVQNARLTSLNTDAARFPVAFLAARAERSEPSKNAGK